MSVDDKNLESFLDETLTASRSTLWNRFGGNLEISVKADASIVTDADLASEKIILENIKKAYPDDLILSEESGLSSESRDPGDFIWIIDPLDGTTNFANRYPFFAVSIARGVFNKDGLIEIVAGGVADPAQKKNYIATKGQGAHCNGTPFTISKPKKFEDGFLVTGFAYKTGNELRSDIDTFSKVASECKTIRRDGAAALDLAYVACGVYDAFWESGLGPWDVAAGSLLVTEAGGKVRNYTHDCNQFYNIEGEGIITGESGFVSKLETLVL